MDKFTQLTAIAAPLDMINVDTDMLIPKQFLRTIKRSGLGINLFDELRFNADGSEKDDFILNQPPYRHAEILITGENFGCGSSREHAPWALLDFGIKCVIAPSFADIFFSNCFKNGILPITLPQAQVDLLMQEAKDKENCQMTIDLDALTITSPQQAVVKFTLDDFKRHCLLNGLDDIGLTLQNTDKIDDFEKGLENNYAWV